MTADGSWGAPAPHLEKSTWKKTAKAIYVVFESVIKFQLGNIWNHFPGLSLTLRTLGGAINAFVTQKIKKNYKFEKKMKKNLQIWKKLKKTYKFSPPAILLTPSLALHFGGGDVKMTPSSINAFVTQKIEKKPTNLKKNEKKPTNLTHPPSS